MSSQLFVDSLVYKMLSYDFLQTETVSTTGKMEAHTTHKVKETQVSGSPETYTIHQDPAQGNTLSKEIVGKGGFLTDLVASRIQGAPGMQHSKTITHYGVSILMKQL